MTSKVTKQIHSIQSSAKKLRPLSAEQFTRKSNLSRSGTSSVEKCLPKVNPYVSVINDKTNNLRSTQQGISDIALKKQFSFSQSPPQFGTGGSQERYNSAAIIDKNQSKDSSLQLLSKNLPLMNVQSQNNLSLNKQRPQSSQNQRYASQSKSNRTLIQRNSTIHIVDQSQKINQNSALTLNTLSTEPKQLIIPRRKKSGEPNISDISPELAAQIVRNHILPMFENKPAHRMTGTVYKELKLSDQLNQELQLVREQVQHLLEKLDIITHEKDQQAQTAKDFKIKYLMEKSKLKELKGKIQTVEKTSLIFEQTVAQLRFQVDEMFNFLLVQQQEQSGASQKLEATMYECDKLQGQFDQMNHNQILKKIQQDVAQEQTAKLFQSLGKLPDIFQVSERFQQKIDNNAQMFKGLQSDHADLLQNYQLLLSEKDKVMEQNKDIKDLKLKQDSQRMVMLTTTKTQVHQAELQVKIRNEECNQMRERMVQLESENKILERERAKLKDRCTKLRQRRGVDKNLCLCKICGKEYQESENFNWSCRTHQSEYSGEMWWCCGKTSKDAVGCKYRKHEVRKDDDKDDDEDQEDGQVDEVKMQQIRCTCCKQLGHNIHKCPNDPNFKTISNQMDMNEAYQKEEIRIISSAVQKKTFAQTFVQTTHFLKKCVIQPLNVIKETENYKIPLSQPFKRGAMSFEDYNYTQFNPYILISDQKLAQKMAKDDKSHGVLGFTEALTENRIDNIEQDYEHESLKSKEKQQELKVLDEKLQGADDEGTASQHSQGEAAREEIELNDEEDDEDEKEEMLVVFFGKKQIEEIMQRQAKDQFADLFEQKTEMKSLENVLGRSETTIDIMSFAPKIVENVENNKTKKNQRRKMKIAETNLDEATVLAQNQAHEEYLLSQIVVKTEEQLAQEQNEITMVQLRKMEEKIVLKEINQEIVKKKKKIINDQIDKEIAEEIAGEMELEKPLKRSKSSVSSRKSGDSTPYLGQKKQTTVQENKT